MTGHTESEAVYVERLDRAIESVVSEGATSLATVVACVSGAFPTLVQERLEVLDLLDGLTRPHRPSRSVVVAPELHVLDFEWYFTAETSLKLAAELPHPAGTVALGAPTVAHALSGIGSESTLLDSSPYLARRFSPGPGTVQVRSVDLESPPSLGPLRSFDAAFFDAPWYVSDIMSWLAVALRLVRKGGRIGFALFGEYTRPNAVAERQQILDFCATLGPVLLEPNRLRYMTPLFESEVLSLTGLEALGDWRTADLVWVGVESEAPTCIPGNAPTVPAAQWHSFVIGTQVVKLREGGGSGDSDFLLETVAGSHDMVFPSVSRRAADRLEVDVWTSRNRVARAGDWRRLHAVLRELSDGVSLSEAIAPLEPGLRDSTFHLMETLLATRNETP